MSGTFDLCIIRFLGLSSCTTYSIFSVFYNSIVYTDFLIQLDWQRVNKNQRKEFVTIIFWKSRFDSSLELSDMEEEIWIGVLVLVIYIYKSENVGKNDFCLVNIDWGNIEKEDFSQNIASFASYICLIQSLF